MFSLFAGFTEVLLKAVTVRSAVLTGGFCHQSQLFFVSRLPPCRLPGVRFALFKDKGQHKNGFLMTPFYLFIFSPDTTFTLPHRGHVLFGEVKLRSLIKLLNVTSPPSLFRASKQNSRQWQSIPRLEWHSWSLTLVISSTASFCIAAKCCTCMRCIHLDTEESVFAGEAWKKLKSLMGGGKAALTVLNSTMTHAVLWLSVTEHRIFPLNQMVDTWNANLTSNHNYLCSFESTLICSTCKIMHL